MSFSEGFVSRSPKNSGCHKVVPWDKNPWDSWDWDKNRSESPDILSFETKIRGTGSPVPCPSLWSTYHLERSERLRESLSTYRLEQGERLKWSWSTYKIPLASRLARGWSWQESCHKISLASRFVLGDRFLSCILFIKIRIWPFSPFLPDFWPQMTFKVWSSN